MKNNVCLLIFCLHWTFRYSAALTNCCHVTRTEWADHVRCSGCQLQDVPQDLPINTTLLNLWNNSIVKLNRNSFTYLPNLETLSLAKNGMSNITPGTFAALENLKCLDLSENVFEHSAFDCSVFKNLLQLRHLRLHRNNFHLKKIYPENAISCIKSLQSLSIDIFEGFTFGKGFLSLTKLNKLDVYRIGVDGVSIRNTSFKGLENSEISHLNLDFSMKMIETDSLSPFGSLVSLRLHSHNTLSIQEVLLALYGLRGRHMESIKLTNNYFYFGRNGNLEKSDLVFLGTICVRRLDLTRNRISGITMDAVLSWTSRSCLEVLNLSENVIQSPQLLFLLVLFPSITHVYASHEVSIFTQKRRSFMIEEQTVFFPKSLLYLYLSHNPIGGEFFNITISDGNNLRVLDISYPLIGLTCSGGFLKGLVHLKELYISGLECSNPNTQMFAEFPNLSRLEAKECNLGDRLSLDAKSLFTGLYNLSFIDVSFNNIKSLNLKTFKDQANSLKILNLTGNIMDHLPLETLKSLEVLETLDVSNNHISTLSDTERSYLDAYISGSEKFKMYLAGNPLICSCDSWDFISWLHTTQAIQDRETMSCSTQEGNKIKIEEFLKSFDQFQESCVAQFWLIISATSTVMLFLVGILFRLAWRHIVCLRVRCRQPLEHETYPYDLFIVYCYEDTKWVAKTLVPWLDEKDIEYCIDEKSFNPLFDMADNIMDAIDNSHQTVFVVSCTFLEREWPMFAMQLASTYSFRDGRENMNIIILLNDMKCSEFPKLIRKNWGVIRPLHWPNESNTDKKQLVTDFWKRLLRRIQRRNDRFLAAPVSTSSV